MIPSCFSQPNTPSSKIAREIDHHHHGRDRDRDRDDHDEEEEEENDEEQNKGQSLITCIYQATVCDSPTYLTLTWCKTPSSHTLTIHASNASFSTTVSLRPPAFSLFRLRPGSKSIYLTRHNKLKLYWDFTRAHFSRGSAEPDSRFYLALASAPSRAESLDFFLGDLPGELSRRVAAPSPPMISRREHAFGRGRRYSSRAVLSGSRREIGIECGGGTLRVSVDGEARLVVKRLAWKFRGNERITVGGAEVEFFWDVFNWVSGDGNGHGVFVFQAGDGGVWPEMVGPERRLLRKSLSSSATATIMDKSSNNKYYYCNNSNNNNCYNYNYSGSSALSYSPSCSSVLQWAEESSDGGSRSSCSSSARSSVGNNNNNNINNGGFSLLLYAWRK